MTKKIKLENGLRIVLEPMPYMKSVSIGIFIKSGSVFETKETNGTAHFIEHMLFKGTKKRTTQQISEEADDLGGTLNAYTAEECTCIYIKVLAKDTKRALDLVLDIASESVFDENAIENEKKVIIEEIASANDNPEDAAQEMLMSNMFRNHPVGMPVLGNEDNVSSFTKQSLTEYYNLHYTPDRMVISVAGALNEDDVLDEIGKCRFANEKACGITDVQKPAETYGGFYFSKRDIGQLQLVAGWPSVPRGDDRLYAFTLLSGIFGSDNSSRLFRRLREEKGLVYNVDASTLDYENTGVFLVNTSFSAENTDTVCRIIREEIKDILANGVTEKELNCTRRNLLNALMLETESTMSMMSIMGKRELFGLKLTDEEILARYNAVTNDDIKQAAKIAFGSFGNEAISVIGDTTKKKISILG